MSSVIDETELPKPQSPENDDASRGVTELRSRWKTLGEFADDVFSTTPPAPAWLLTRGDASKGGEKKGVMRLGKVGLLVAAGGIGKTKALVLLALAVATGGWWLGTFHAARPGRVLLALGEEDMDEVWRRIHSTARMLNLGPDELAAARKNIVALPLAGVPVALVTRETPHGDVTTTPVLEALRAKLAESEGWSLIALDPLSRWAGADTEKDNASATRFIEAVETLLSAPGSPAVLIAHHTPKSDRGPNAGQVTARGASALHDGARWVATLEALEASDFVKVRKEDPEPPTLPLDVVRFAITKSNYSELGEPVRLTRDRTKNGALRPLTTDEEEQLEAWRDSFRKAPASRRAPAKEADDGFGNL